MAAKVTQQDVEDAGFRAEQFGTPGMQWTEYLARLIDRVSVWAQGRFGAGYATVAEDTPTFEHLRAAELCWVTAHLWKSRAAFIDSNAASSREAPAYADRRQYLEAGAQAMECAESNMLLAIGGDSPYPGTGAALVAVETGPYLRGPCMGWSQ